MDRFWLGEIWQDLYIPIAQVLNFRPLNGIHKRLDDSV